MDRKTEQNYNTLGMIHPSLGEEGEEILQGDNGTKASA